MSAVLYSLALVAVIIYLAYHYFTRNFNHWKQRGVTGPQPKFFFGNYKDAFTKKRCFAHEMDDIYKAYKKTDDFVGVFSGHDPHLLILNPDIAKNILITNFSSFSSNSLSEWVKGKKDLLIDDHPFVLTGQDWKDKRSEIIPNVTSAKLKQYFPVIINACSKLIKFVKDNDEEFQNQVDATDLLFKFTGEVICDIGWGLEAGAFTSKDDCQFIKASRQLVIDFFAAVDTLILSSSISFFKYFKKMEFVKKRSADFFGGLTKLALENRINGKERNDLLQFLINLQDKKNLTHEELLSRQLVFVLDAIDTTAVIAANVLLLIARHKSVQTKLRTIINEMADGDGTLDCDALQQQEYLDNIVHESLRLFTPVGTIGIQKLCTKSQELTGKNGKSVKLKPNDVINIPIHSFHNDSEYYEEPEKFNPDRFSEENGGVKKFKDAGVLLPFGAGPRICPGTKLALVLVKSAVVELVRNFDIQVHEKTRSDYFCVPGAFVMKLQGGIHLKFKAL